MLFFPFSVAVTNSCLGIALAIAMVSGLWWQGIQKLYEKAQGLSFALLAYFTLMMLGLLWSLDVSWGLHVVGRQWFWLLIPVVVVSLAEEKWRNYLLLSLSLGLILNLIFCVLQIFSIVDVPGVAGSSADDATGHIGHIGFGVVYGIWAAWLLHVGWQRSGIIRMLAWLFSAWSYILIFAAQGRGGYVIAVALFILVVVQQLRKQKLWRMVLWMTMFIALSAAVLVLGPAKERIQATFTATTTTTEVTKEQRFAAMTARGSNDQRVEMWNTSLLIWSEYPWFGVGTGGLPEAVKSMEINTGAPFIVPFVHPHNQYLLVLVRWSATGLILLLLCFFYWLKQGWSYSWDNTLAYPLVALSGTALMLHGLFAPSLEEHFSGVLAAVLLGVGLAESVNRGSENKLRLSRTEY